METRAEYTATSPDHKQFLLRMPATLHASIKAQAKRDRRSMTQTMILALEQFLASRQIGELE